MKLIKTAFAEKQGISVPVLDTWIYRHGLPVVQIGRRVYIDDGEFQKWWAEHRKVVPIKVPDKPVELAIPARVRKSSIAHKMQRIY